MNINELRIGNYILDGSDMKKVDVIRFNANNFIQADGKIIYHTQVKPVPLSENILLKCGFIKSSNCIISNPYTISIGRDKFLTITNVGTPNEMIFLKDLIDEHNDLIVIHNYDYRGFCYLHQLQNIFFCLSGKELNIKL